VRLWNDVRLWKHCPSKLAGFGGREICKRPVDLPQITGCPEVRNWQEHTNCWLKKSGS